MINNNVYGNWIVVRSLIALPFFIAKYIPMSTKFEKRSGGALYLFTGFLLSPIIAGGAMALSSVSVVSNSLLMKRKKL